MTTTHAALTSFDRSKVAAFISWVSDTEGMDFKLVKLGMSKWAAMPNGDYDPQVTACAVENFRQEWRMFS